LQTPADTLADPILQILVCM